MDSSETYLLLILTWVCWCGLHSALISVSVTNYLEKLLGERFRFYRLAYNLFSSATLAVPVLVGLSLQQSETALFIWSGGVAGMIRFSLLGSALILFVSAAKNYDTESFLGISQLRSRHRSHLLNNQSVFSASGVSTIVRHPWYLGGILFVWSAAKVLYPSTVIAAAIISGYFVVGTILEEQKLVKQFGDSYRFYQQSVPMLFPYKWLGAIFQLNKKKGD